VPAAPVTKVPALSMPTGRAEGSIEAEAKASDEMPAGREGFPHAPVPTSVVCHRLICIPKRMDVTDSGGNPYAHQHDQAFKFVQDKST
jgi:hypothetical protein